MPELPEVETIRRDLAAAIVGRRVVRAEVLDASLVHAPSVEGFGRGLRGKTVQRADRRGKYLLLHLDDGVLVLHLMMSGRIFLRPARDPVGHTRLVVEFDRGPALHFVDMRRFGRAWLLPPPGVDALLADLGPEPLEPEFDGRVLQAAVGHRRRAIKPTLLDQRIVAGVGNIYADEALWLARIHPETPAGSLSLRRLNNLARGDCHHAAGWDRVWRHELSHPRWKPGRARSVSGASQRLSAHRGAVPALRPRDHAAGGRAAGDAHLPAVSAAAGVGAVASVGLTEASVSFRHAAGGDSSRG